MATLTGTTLAKTTDKNKYLQRKLTGALNKAHTDKTLLKLTDVLLNGKNGEQHIRAAKSLKKIGSRRVGPALTKAADHRVVKDVAVRRAALVALCEVNKKWAKRRLHDVLATDPAVSMRALAAEQLGDIDGAKTLQVLVATVQKTSEDMNVRMTAIVSLGKLGDKKAVPVLTSLSKNGSKRLRLKAIAALGEIKKEIIRSELHRSGRLPFRLR